MDTPVRRNIVVSAVNLRKGGTLTVLRDCLQYLSGRGDLHVTAVVHNSSLCGVPGIDFIEIPWSAKSWLRRLWCEYVTLGRISGRLPETDLWLSLHDTTPRVKARSQAVYCHTTFPFMRTRPNDWKMDPKIAIFSLFTKYAYRWNSLRNRYLIVQQDWMRDAMSRLTGFEKDRIIVAPPAFRPVEIPESDPVAPYTFLYPSTPDAHKDFETFCEAARILECRVGHGKFKAIVTVAGTENRYARWLFEKWGSVQSVNFAGLMSRERLGQAYAEASCLVSPSRSESWGLPISEFMPTGKPMILADLPYAHETAAGAPSVAYFPLSDAEALAGVMQSALEGNTDCFAPVPPRSFNPPFASGWEGLFNLLLQ